MFEAGKYAWITYESEVNWPTVLFVGGCSRLSSNTIFFARRSLLCLSWSDLVDERFTLEPDWRFAVHEGLRSETNVSLRLWIVSGVLLKRKVGALRTIASAATRVSLKKA